MHERAVLCGAGKAATEGLAREARVLVGNKALMAAEGVQVSRCSRVMPCRTLAFPDVVTSPGFWGQLARAA